MVVKTDEAGKTETDIRVDHCPQAGGYTVRIISPFNSIHRVGGFKTADDAQTWIGEARILIGASRWFD